MERPSPIPSHLVEITTPEHSAWQGFFQGFSHAAQREHVPLNRFSTHMSFPYKEARELSLFTVIIYQYNNNPLEFIKSLFVPIWRGNKWVTTAAATGIFLQDNLHLVDTNYIRSARSGLSQQDILHLLQHVGGILEQPQEYDIYPMP